MFRILFIFFIIYQIYKWFFKSNIISGFSGRNSYERPKDFETSLLMLSSIIIKADGVINKSELNFVRDYFVKSYGKEKANQSFRKFKNVVQQHISSRQICLEIRGFMPYQSRVQLIDFLFKVAYADGQVSQYEELEIRKIASYMLVGQMDYIRLRSFYFQQSYRGQEQQYSSTYSENSDYDYEVLGLTENATTNEIKKAYRSLAKKYHPDRLQNASKQDIEIAKEKFQKIQSAYENIKNSRGF